MKSPTLLFLALASAATASAGTLEKATQAFQEQRLDEAKSLFETLKNDSQNQAEAYAYLGRIAQARGDLDAAEEALEKAVKLKSDQADYHFYLGQVNCSQAQSASMFSALGYAKDCKKHFQDAARLAPENLDYREALFSYDVQAPGIAGGDIDEAKTIAADVGKKDELRGLMMNAQLAEHDEDWAHAATLYRSAIEKAPNQPDYAFALGMMQQRAEQYAEALKTFQEILARQPDYAPAQYQIGRSAVLGKQGLEAGEKALNAYLSAPEQPNQPTHAWAHFRLGQIYDLMGKKTDGKAQYQLAEAATPDEKLKKELRKLR